MKIKRTVLSLLIVLSALSASAAIQPDGFQKEQVRSVIRKVQKISARCRSLDEFGQATVDQGKKILSFGPPAVYTLSTCLDDPDWKVRFWIADILGYLENGDAVRPLRRLINDPGERTEVREQAGRSLKRIEMPLERSTDISR